LRDLWCDARDQARSAAPGSPAFARVADLAASYWAMATQAGRPDRARDVVGDALATLRAACLAQPGDPARHMAFGRTLELAAATELARGERQAAFDALRAAIATVGRFAPTLRDPAADPLARMATAASLLRPLTTAARMLDDRRQRRMAFRQMWEESLGWIRAAKGQSDHVAAIESAVIAAFEVAVEDHGASSRACLERCEELKAHMGLLHRARGDDWVVRSHRAALARLTADAWTRMGDADEARRMLDEARRHLDKAVAMPDTDRRALDEQRAALARQRAALEPAAGTAGGDAAGRARVAATLP
jgi:hypothetical protein